MPKFIFIIIGLLIIIGIGAIVFYSTQKNNYNNKNNVLNLNYNLDNNIESNTTTDTNFKKDLNSKNENINKLKSFTKEKVSLHNSKESCWSIINGYVYDLTSWIPNHLGWEDKIFRICGIDGSRAFNKKHSDAEKPINILMGFKIGELSQ